MPSNSIKTISNFQQGIFPFPKDEISPKDKNEQWAQKWGEAIYSAYVNERTAIPYSKLNEMDTLRAYAAGNQDIQKYQKVLLTEAEEGAEELEGYLNVNWDIFSVMPKFLHIIQGIFEQQEHAIIATAVDPKSTEEKELSQIRKWFKAKYKDIINEVRQINKQDPLSEWLPESVDELELYKTMGGFKLAKEMEIEEALQYTFYISDWTETKRKIISDFVTINCAATKDYTDQYTNKAKIRYVDPRNLIMQYSKHWDHRNSEYAGEIIKETISNIRKNTNLSEDQLRNIAQFYNGRNLNPSLASWSTDDLMSQGSSGYKYDSFLIDILDYEWFSIDEKYRTTRTNSRGETVTYDDDWGKVHNSEKRKTEIKRYKTVYKAKWIIGTDFVYDFGHQYDITRPGKKEVELSYKLYVLPGRSIVSLSVPNLDQVQLTWLKMQNALAMSSNAGVAVEYTSLQNMTLGGQKMQPLEILSIRRDTGDLIYKLTTHQGRPNTPGGCRPIQELEGGIGRQLEEFIRLFDLNLNFIRDVTGINQIADASTPDPNQSVGGSQLAVAATTNALRPIYSAYVRMKELSARSSALRVQLLVRHSKKAYEGYIPVVGSAGVKILSVGTDIMDADYHIKIQARPTEQRKQVILQAAMQAMAPDREGYVGIEYPEFLMVERMLEDGNLKYAEYFLAYRSQKNKERQDMRMKENQKLDAEYAQNTAVIKEEETRKTKQLDTDEKIRFEQAKAEIEDGINAREHEREKEKIILQAQAKAQLETQKV
jgi:hypothetical protein